MKKGFLTKILFASIVLSATPVEAKGNATVEFIGNNEVTVGETFTIYMNVKDIYDTYDGIVSLGGNISFDEQKLQYISSKGSERPYLFQINEDFDYKIAGLDFTLDNGIRSNMTVYEFTFKALEEGDSSITLSNAKLTDSKDYIDTVVIEKNVKIKGNDTDISNDKSTEDTVAEDIIEKNESAEDQTVTGETESKETETAVESNEETIISRIDKIIKNILKSLLDIFK